MKKKAPILVSLTPSSRTAIKLLAGLALCAALYFAKSFFLPIAAAIVLALTLSPIVQAAQKLGIPAILSAAVVTLGLTTVMIAGTMTLATPAALLVAKAPTIGPELERKLRAIRRPVKSINDVSKEVEKIADENADGRTQEVVIKQPGLVTRAADDILIIVVNAALTLALTFFLLVSRDMFIEKTVRVLPTLSDKKTALHVAHDVERDVSHYLFTISIINFGLGILVGTAMWLTGMPNPLLWGVLAGLLNFLPIVGAGIGIVVTAMVAIIHFDTLSAAALPPLFYLALTAIEGQFLTPMILGKRLSLNTVVILVSIAFWGFLWGAVGVLIAMPLLIILKVFCERVEGLNGLGEFLSSTKAPTTIKERSEAAE